MKPPILLVHGSFHTGECWELILPALAELGLEAHALTLGGHRGNPRPASEVSMRSYASDVIERAEQIGGRPLLLGHSMGGLVISEAAERRPDLFCGMIYLAAFVPPAGRVSTADLPPISEGMMAAIAAGLEHRLDGTAVFPAEASREVFYNGCDPAIQDFALARLSPQPLLAARDFVETTEARWGAVRKHYVECTRDQALPIESQRATQANARFGSIRTLVSDHSPFYSQPAELADVIGKIAADGVLAPVPCAIPPGTAALPTRCDILRHPSVGEPRPSAS